MRAEVVQTSALERASGKTHGELDLCTSVMDALGWDCYRATFAYGTADGANQGANSG
jgi:hypothetical protein